MAYTDREMKNATQVAYADFSKVIKAMPPRAEPYSIQELMNAIDNKTVKVSGSFDSIRELMNSGDQSDWNMIKNWKIVSTHDTNASNGFYGCLIDTGGGNAIVGFRGSESMNDPHHVKTDWVEADLGLLNSTLTKQQAEAELFMKEISQSGYIKNYNNLAVTGHSLGGNLAEHATVMSGKYGLDRLITQCISFDGPGFSDEYIRENAARIRAMADKMTHYQWSLVGNLLHMLPGVEFRSLKTKDGDLVYNLIGKHDSSSIMFDENGNAITGKTDPFSALIGSFSRGVDRLPKPIGDLLILAVSALVIAVSWAADKMFDENGNLTAFGWAVVIGAAGLVVVFGLGTVIAFIGVVLLVVVAAIAIIALANWAYESLCWLVEKACELAGKAWDWLKDRVNDLKNFVGSILNGLKDWWNKNFNAGYKYAASNPYYKVDTAKLRDYAVRVDRVNRRLRELDSSLRRVFWEVSPGDMWRFAWINMLTSGSPSLLLVKNQLSGAADRFETAENKARGYVGG